MSVTVHELAVPLPVGASVHDDAGVKLSVEFVENATLPAGDDLVPRLSISFTVAVTTVA